jgi:tetratricopeptide (TPR) repeat protein
MGDSARLEELRRRVESDPASIAFATLAEEYRRAGRFDEAVEATRAGLRFHPTYVSARVTLGRSLMELDEHGQAERELRLVLKSSPDNLAARRALGDLYWRQSDVPRALEQFQSAVALAPGDHELADIVQSLQREVASTTASAEPDGTAANAAAGAGPNGAAASNGSAPNGSASTSDVNGSGHGPVLVALERFYRAIVNARDARRSGAQTH